MELDVARTPNTMIGESASASDAVARAWQRIQGWFRPCVQEQANREANIRWEERRKERERIAQDLHDTLLQGFLGVSMLLNRAVEETPEDTPSKSSLSQVLQLMQRTMEEGRLALQGLRSHEIASAPLEQALADYAS